MIVLTLFITMIASLMKTKAVEKREAKANSV